MNCLEKYRSKLIRDVNRQLGILVEYPHESAVHDFRVGIKRLTAFYLFLNQVDEKLPARKLLKPYRGLFKQVGYIRDAHIAMSLVEDLDGSPGAESRSLIRSLQTRIRGDYRRFLDYVGNDKAISIRLPTIRATGIPQTAMLRHRPAVLEQLLTQILAPQKRMTDAGWHKRRILLKRYHHTLDAFSLCPGQVANPRLLKHVSLLEQLLGDWHDRVVTAELLQSLPGPAANREALVRRMKNQDRMLLGAAKIYLDKFAAWHAANRPAR